MHCLGETKTFVPGEHMLKRTLKSLVFCLLTGTLAAQAGQFLEAPQYATGTHPQAVAFGDFNGDGNQDLAIVNTTANTVSVLLGNGDGTFGAKVDYPTGSAPMGVAVGDFNGDRHIDLAITNSTSATVSILLGNGDGTFQAKKDTAVGNGPLGVTAGDFNNDGNVDIAVANSTDGTVGVLLGNGDGTFKAQATYRTGNNPTAIVAADFNNDKVLDLAVANNNNFAQSGVSLFLGKGDGTFQGQLQATTGLNPVSIAVGDFNGDKNLDIVVANGGPQGYSVSILLGNGKGGFGTNVDYPTGLFPTSVSVADFNGDGKLDLAVSSGDGNAVSVLWGVGDGTFQGQVIVGAGDIPSAVVVADSQANTVSIILNNGNETFQSRTDYPAGHSPYSVATTDFNGDGFLDLAVANSNGSVSIVLGNGDGTFGAPTPFSTGSGTDPYAVIVADFNGDKKQDIAVANYGPKGTVGIFLGNGDGTLQTQVLYDVGAEPASLTAGDFRGVGNLDLAVANFNDNTVSILLGNGDGTFKAAVPPTLTVGSGPVSVAVGDFNGDKKLDLVVVNETDNNVGILLGNGDGTFKPQVTYCVVTTVQCVGGNPRSVVVGDFNGDHFLDLAVADFQSQQVTILLGNGDGTFQAPKLYPAGANPSSIVAADFNGDGLLDLAVTSIPLGLNPGNLVSLLLGNGDGTFKQPQIFGAGYLSHSAVVGDFNGDSAPDLATANGGSNTVSVLLNARGTAMTFVSSANPSALGQSVMFTATLATSVPNGTPPTGTVTISNGTTVIGSGTLVGGQFSASPSSLPGGTDTISAVYSGDVNYQKHTVKMTQAVNQIVQSGTTTVLNAPASANLNQSVTFTATIAPTIPGAGTPTGMVAFVDGAKQIGTSSLNGSVATLSISTLSAGAHSITAAYGGDTNFTASTSSAVNLAVAAPDFGLSSGALNPSSIAPGKSAQSTVTVTPFGGLDPSTVALTCKISPAVTPAATCSLAVISVANNTGTATLTVTAAGPTAALTSPAGRMGSGTLFMLGLMIPAILFVGSGMNKPARRKLVMFSLVFLVIGGCVFQVACGGGGGGSNTTPPPTGNSGTPAGTYSVVVTGSANGTQHSTSAVSVTVQ